MRSVSGVGRAAAMAAVIAAVVLVAVLLFGGGGSGYTVTADFLNAGQLVKGNPVQTGGVPIGSVKSIDITDEGQAVIEFSVDDDHSPLPVGTHVTIRQFSQSGIANRYIDLTFPPESQSDGQKIDDGGHIAADNTTTAVDLDELFNTLDPKTRKALQGFFKGQARQFENMGKEANVGFEYLNPALSTSSRFFNELTRDKPVLERFLVDSSQLVTALAEKRDDLSSLISQLSTTTTALASQKTALADSISELPPFMRRANTTFVNLRAALDDVDPLVDASKPAVRAARPVPQRRTRARRATREPTVRDLRITIDRNGKDNDLIDLLNSFPELADLATVTRERTASPGGKAIDVGETRGALPESAEAFENAAPEIAFGRPYTTDFFGWFDDFSTTGAGFDALGATARGHLVFSETPRRHRRPATSSAARAARSRPPRRLERALPGGAGRAQLQGRGQGERLMKRALSILFVLGAGFAAFVFGGASDEDGGEPTTRSSSTTRSAWSSRATSGSAASPPGRRAPSTSSRTTDGRALAAGRGQGHRAGLRRPARGRELRDQAAVADRRVLRRLPARQVRQEAADGRQRGVPVEQNFSTIPTDLVNDIMRAPVPRAAAADPVGARHRPRGPARRPRRGARARASRPARDQPRARGSSATRTR